MVPAIVLGDPTTGGGKVIEGSSGSTIMGKPIARVGDKATCTIKGHGGVVTILEGSASDIIDGKPTAFDKCSLSCGCKVMATQGLYLVDTGGGGGSAGKTSSNKQSANVAPKNKDEQSSEFNDFFIVKDAEGKPLKYSKYAIEFPDGTIEYGTTDATGHTDLHVTGEEAKALIVYIQGA